MAKHPPRSQQQRRQSIRQGMVEPTLSSEASARGATKATQAWSSLRAAAKHLLRGDRSNHGPTRTPQQSICKRGDRSDTGGKASAQVVTAKHPLHTEKRLWHHRTMGQTTATKKMRRTQAQLRRGSSSRAPRVYFRPQNCPNGKRDEWILRRRLQEGRRRTVRHRRQPGARPGRVFTEIHSSGGHS